MVYQRIFRSLMVLFAVGLMFAACGTPEPPTPQSEFCAVKCNCSNCPQAEEDMCTDDLTNQARDAELKQCRNLFDTYLACLNENGKCTSRVFDESACVDALNAMNACIDPPVPCPTVDNGVCNEPAPAGDDTCDAGTDTNDCMPPPMCPTANNGMCDEPEGTNTCPEGTDPIDCPCAKCSEYIVDQTGNMLCQASNKLFSDLFACVCDNLKCLPDCQAMGDFCGAGPFSQTCLACVNMKCMTEYGSCQQDK